MYQAWNVHCAPSKPGTAYAGTHTGHLLSSRLCVIAHLLIQLVPIRYLRSCDRPRIPAGQPYPRACMDQWRGLGIMLPLSDYHPAATHTNGGASHRQRFAVASYNPIFPCCSSARTGMSFRSSCWVNYLGCAQALRDVRQQRALAVAFSRAPLHFFAPSCTSLSRVASVLRLLASPSRRIVPSPYLLISMRLTASPYLDSSAPPSGGFPAADW